MSDVDDNNDLPSLPPGWAREYSNSQKRYFYFHKETKHTQWHFPTASEAKDPLKAKKRAEMNKEQHRSEKQESTKRPAEGSSGNNNGGASAASASASVDPASKRPRPTSSSSAGSNATSSSSPSRSIIGRAAAKKSADDDFLELADATSVAIIVPFRDIHSAQKRAHHLSLFLPHMHTFFGKLLKQRLVSDYHIYIVEQSDDGRKFNRGKLLNIGFDMACKNTKKNLASPHDVFIFHDVDLLPSEDLGPWYAKFPKRPIHIARVWDRYSNNPKYFGGVVSFSKTNYRKINGYPNTFWGWGGEDDEMHNRLERLGLTPFDAPNRGSLVDLEEMNINEKLDFLRDNKEWKCMVKWEALEEHEETWKTNGMSDLKYKVLKITPLDATKKATKITCDVLLNGDHWANTKCGMEYMPDWNDKKK